MPFAKILVANRGEIAVRIARTAKRLGYATVAVFSEADRDAPHRLACDEAAFIGPAPALESYLNVERILAAARATGADAVHPGYGFLSENAGFAAACEAAGLCFIGPPPSAISAMADKAASKALMADAGVPVLKSFSQTQTSDAFARAAAEIGYPVMLKATAGGGGKGMRLARSEAELRDLFETTKLEARRAFASDDLLVERALTDARHVEIQVFADRFGGVTALGERDCSVQRRHQKVLEEAPSPAVDAALRAAMEAAAVAAARAVGYVGAGTVEFLLARDRSFYFLEMNTRLQVEHAVTEAITGIDLVAWQLRVAAGEPLEALGAEFPRAAHAIEARLYAEDPAGGFLPQAGRIVRWRPPAGPSVRVDAALGDGLAVTPYYDPMLAKIVASGASREEARRTLVRALDELICFGLPTNRRFLIAALDHPAFASGDADTSFIGTYGAALTAAPGNGDDDALLALAAVLLYRNPTADPIAGWQSRPGMAVPLTLVAGERTLRARVERRPHERFAVALPAGERELTVIDDDGASIRFAFEGAEQTAHYAREGTTLYLQAGTREAIVTDATFTPRGESETSERTATAPMPGVVVRVAVAVGDLVERGQTLVVLEAMKMMHEIAAGASGPIERVLVEPGRQVARRAPLVEIGSAG